MIEERGQWKKLSSKVIHQNPFYSVREDEVIKPNGSPGVYNVVDGVNAVYIVALDDDNNIYLIGQYRYTNNNFSIEVPCGHIDKGETPLQAAKRELTEETGLVAKKWLSLGVIYPSNGIISGKHHVFIAQELTETENNEQAEEGITKLLKVKFSEAMAMVSSREISGSDVIASLTLAALKLNLSLK